MVLSLVRTPKYHADFPLVNKKEFGAVMEGHQLGLGRTFLKKAA
jgi:hypothetical protein